MSDISGPFFVIALVALAILLVDSLVLSAIAMHLIEIREAIKNLRSKGD